MLIAIVVTGIITVFVSMYGRSGKSIEGIAEG